jgi:cytoskeleton protein RodZ
MVGEGEPREGGGVGTILRNARERAGLDIDLVAYRLHIRQRFLEGIENGCFEALPAPVYAVGFVRAYANYLSLDAEDLAQRFRKEIVRLGAAAPLHFPLPMIEGGTPKGAVLLIGAVIAIVAYGSWYVMSSRGPDMAQTISPIPERLASIDAVDRRDASTTPGVGKSLIAETPPPIDAAKPTQVVTPLLERGHEPGEMDAKAVPATTAAIQPPPIVSPFAGSSAASGESVEAASGDATVASLTTLAAPSAAALPAAAQSGTAALAAEPTEGEMPSTGDSSARIVLRARAESWVEVRDPQRNALVMARLLKAGDVYRVPDQPGLKLVTGNAGGLVVLVDGQVAPPLGKDGVVRRGISLDAASLRHGSDGVGTQ